MHSGKTTTIHCAPMRAWFEKRRSECHRREALISLVLEIYLSMSWKDYMFCDVGASEFVLVLFKTWIAAKEIRRHTRLHMIRTTRFCSALYGNTCGSTGHIIIIQNMMRLYRIEEQIEESKHRCIMSTHKHHSPMSLPLHKLHMCWIKSNCFNSLPINKTIFQNFEINWNAIDSHIRALVNVYEIILAHA